MNNMFCSLAVFLLEYLKLLLSSVFILKLKVNHNKKTTGIFIATLIAVGLVSFTIDVSSYSIILSVIGILLILYELSQKRKIGLVFIIYFFISLVDMASESCVYFFLDISTADAIEKYWITFFADSLSLILISIYYGLHQLLFGKNFYLKLEVKQEDIDKMREIGRAHV